MPPQRGRPRRTSGARVNVSEDMAESTSGPGPSLQHTIEQLAQAVAAAIHATAVQGRVRGPDYRIERVRKLSAYDFSGTFGDPTDAEVWIGLAWSSLLFVAVVWLYSCWVLNLEVGKLICFITRFYWYLCLVPIVLLSL